MSNLFVLKVASEDEAEAILGTLRRLQSQQLVRIDDAALVTRNRDGKPRIRQANDLVGAGALGGAFWGFLIGLLFFNPILGSVVGATAGAIGGKYSDIGIDDNFIKQVGNSIQPGESALFLLTSQGIADKVVPELRQYKFELIQSSLSTEDEAKLHELLGT